MKKKILITLLGILLLDFMIFAGGQKESGEGDTKQKEEVVKEELALYLASNNMPKTFDEINRRFQEKHPEIILKIEPAPSDDQIEPVFRTKIASGVVPDIFMMWPAQIETYSNQNILMDLTDKPYMKNVAEKPQEEMSYNGRVYSMPLSAFFLGTYYNKDIFNEYGIEIPKTWDEFLKVCETLKKNNIIPIALPYKENWASMMFIRAAMSSLLYTQKPNFDQDIREGKITYTTPEMEKIFNRFMMLRDKGFFNDDALGIANEQSYMMLASGKAAMLFNGSWALPPLLELNPDINLGYFPAPVVDNVKNLMATSMVEFGLSIYKDTDVPAAADKYLSFYLEPDIYEVYITANKGASTLKSIDISGDPAFSHIQQYIKNGKYHAFPNFVPGTWIPFMKITQEIFMDQYTVKEGLAEYQRVVEQKLKELE